MSNNAQCNIKGWLLAFYAYPESIDLTVNHVDNSPIFDTGDDIGKDHELGFRLTSERIEAEHSTAIDSSTPGDEQRFIVLDWCVTALVDDDQHLNLYISRQDKAPIVLDSLRNGTEQSTSCDLGIYKTDEE